VKYEGALSHYSRERQGTSNGTGTLCPRDMAVACLTTAGIDSRSLLGMVGHSKFTQIWDTYFTAPPSYWGV